MSIDSGASHRIAHFLKRVIFYSKSCAHLNPSDVWLASFPRSGNSWFRIILANYLASCKQDESLAILSKLDQVLPVLGFSDLSRSWVGVNYLPRVIKTHHAYRRGVFMGPSNAILLYRDPREVLVSYHRFVSARRQNIKPLTISEFLRDNSMGIHAYCRHMESWSRRNPVKVNYQSFVDDPYGTVITCFNSFGFELHPNQLRTAVNQATIKKVAAKEAQEGIRDASRFKKGFKVVGGSSEQHWKEVLSSSDIGYIADVIRKYPKVHLTLGTINANN